MTKRRRKSDRQPLGAPPAGGSPKAQMPDLPKLREILDRANDSERHGFKFGLFPLWVQDYDLSNGELARLITMSREVE